MVSLLHTAWSCLLREQVDCHILWNRRCDSFMLIWRKIHLANNHEELKHCKLLDLFPSKKPLFQFDGSVNKRHNSKYHANALACINLILYVKLWSSSSSLLRIYGRVVVFDNLPAYFFCGRISKRSTTQTQNKVSILRCQYEKLTLSATYKGLDYLMASRVMCLIPCESIPRYFVAMEISSDKLQANTEGSSEFSDKLTPAW